MGKDIVKEMVMNVENKIEAFMVCPDLKEKKKIAMDIVTEIKNYQIIIYGAGAVGTSLLNALKRNGILPKFFVDRRYGECNFVQGIPVYSPQTLTGVSPDDSIVVVAINAEVIRSFNQEAFDNIKNYNQNIEIISSGTNFTSVLQFDYCYTKFNEGKGFNLVECLDCGAETRLCEIYQNYLKEIAPKSKRSDSAKSKSFTWFGYIMGQVCTLKCEHCCEHIPYYNKPVFSKYEDIIADCKKIAESCEFLRFIELIGGEPFLHPDFKRILEGLLAIENVGYIKVFTNATIIPSEELLDLLESKRIVIHVSNYTSQAKGRLLDNIYITLQKLKEHNIRYVYSESKEWTDWGDFHDRQRSEEQLIYNASHCFCYNCHRVFQGILYHCPHQYAGIQRNLMQYIESECIELHSYTCNELADKLEEFERLPFTDGCRRCDMPFDCAIVPAGVQIE